MRILLQFPEGLKAEAVAKARALEAQGNEVLLSASPCYGACDVATAQAKALGADKIIHYGHSQFVDADVPVEYVEYPQEVEYADVAKKALGMLGTYRTVGLVTTVQHVAQLPGIKKLLEKNGKRVLIGKRGARAKHDGQVLGCDQGAAQSIERSVDCFLYFGGGVFHPLGVALAVQKPVLAADPFLKKVFWLDEMKEKFARRRKGALLKALEAKRFGILVSTKPGQFALKEAEALRDALRKRGREAHVLVADEIVPETLENFRAFDCYINTACPRIVEDAERFAKPVLNAGEAREMLNII
jgi:2-(3-amino-3-carboxypropyl)histidine synthase